jgi:hypothetical protein
MVVVKIFCMQKDEDDILEDWIIYHAHLFGYDNIYIVDNESGPKSKEILQRYQLKGVHVSEQPDYRLKGDYLCQLIKENKNACDYAIPLDIDEFIALVDLRIMTSQIADHLVRHCLSLNQSYYLEKYPQIVRDRGRLSNGDALHHYITTGYRLGWTPCPPEQLRNITLIERDQFMSKYHDLLLKHFPQETITCDRQMIRDHLISLPKMGRYSFLYYLTSRNLEMDYDHPTQEVKMFDLIDYENTAKGLNLNKKFFEPTKLISLDHGNHHGRVEGLTIYDYYNTHLVLLHLHHRGVRKLIEKCRNDIVGLKNVKNVDDVNELRARLKDNVIGSHNIQTYLTFKTDGPNALLSYDDEGIEITQLSHKIEELKHLQ